MLSAHRPHIVRTSSTSTYEADAVIDSLQAIKNVFEFEDPRHFGVQGEKEQDKYKRTRSSNNLRRSSQEDPSWWTAEEENDPYQ